ncbi:Uncharacterised protein [Mycobacterium tuberculosis]|nr:Uncharacterised protein [Mycobacterium tuberculosis]
MSRSSSGENGRSSRPSPELAGRSLTVKLSCLFRSSSSAMIFVRASWVS